MKFEYNIWKYQRGNYKLMVDKKSIINRLCKILSTKISCTYYSKKKEVGWDIIIPTKYLPVAEKELKKFKKI